MRDGYGGRSGKSVVITAIRAGRHAALFVRCSRAAITVWHGSVSSSTERKPEIGVMLQSEFIASQLDQHAPCTTKATENRQEYMPLSSSSSAIAFSISLPLSLGFFTAI